jgi:hypothetical protein
MAGFYNLAGLAQNEHSDEGRDVGTKRMTRSGWVVLGAGVAAATATGAVAATQYAQRVELGPVAPAAGSAVATARPLISLAATNADEVRNLRVLIDGKDRTRHAGRSDDGTIVLKSGRLPDGMHTVEVRFGTKNVFSRSISRTWSFMVDTKLPTLAVKTPKAGAEVNAKAMVLTGRTEPDAKVRVGWKGGSAEGVAGPKGVWRVATNVPDGPVALRVIATDPAGNASVATRRVIVDTTAPKLQLAKMQTRLTETDTPVFYGTIAGETAARAIVGATVNGREIVAPRGGTAPDANGQPQPGVTFTGTQFVLSVGRLPQGRNNVKIFVRDPAGNHTEKGLDVLVDSTEDLGDRDLIKGARGADVKALQKSLRDRGFRRVKVNGVYDQLTVRGVRNYQRVHGLKQSGVFGPNTRTRFFGRIVVDLSAFRLALIRDGKVVKSFKIAHGSPAYPTPTGKYRIVNKQQDPTWTPPPDSSWAKGLGPIPPGPGNPLGTRWMGTSAPYVGIHGTPAAGSIGTRASHGCIRMRIPDAEALYEDVIVGMPVQIVA